MINQIFLQILQYNIRKSLKIQKSFLINREVCKFNIIVIQKQDHNINILQMFSSTHNFFHLMKDSSFQAKTCIYVNKQISDETHLYMMLTTNLLFSYSKV